MQGRRNTRHGTGQTAMRRRYAPPNFTEILLLPTHSSISSASPDFQSAGRATTGPTSLTTLPMPRRIPFSRAPQSPAQHHSEIRERSCIRAPSPRPRAPHRVRIRVDGMVPGCYQGAPRRSSYRRKTTPRPQQHGSKKGPLHDNAALAATTISQPRPITSQTFDPGTGSFAVVQLLSQGGSSCDTEDQSPRCRQAPSSQVQACGEDRKEVRQKPFPPGTGSPRQP